jgi:hypothetical protein
MIIKFFLYVNNYNNGPQIRIWKKDELLLEKTLTKEGPETIEIDTDLQLPSSLIVEHHGKNMKYDTKIVDGKIVDDKGFVIEKIQIDKFTLHNEVHHFKFVTENGDEITKSNYIGHNGKFFIDIDAKHISIWYYKLRAKLLQEVSTFDYDEFKEEIFEGNFSEVSY